MYILFSRFLLHVIIDLNGTFTIEGLCVTSYGRIKQKEGFVYIKEAKLFHVIELFTLISIAWS